MNKKIKKYLIILFILAVIVLVFLAIYMYLHRNKTSSHAIYSGNRRANGSSQSYSPGQSSTTNQNSNTTELLPPSSSWVSSTNKGITLQQPSQDSTIKSGDTISGIANVSTVQYILSDNKVGLIDQGVLNVVNGKFSGTLHFSPHSNIGSLQLYYPDPSNGAEEDIINIGVNF